MVTGDFFADKDNLVLGVGANHEAIAPQLDALRTTISGLEFKDWRGHIRNDSEFPIFWHSLLANGTGKTADGQAAAQTVDTLLQWRRALPPVVRLYLLI